MFLCLSLLLDVWTFRTLFFSHIFHCLLTVNSMDFPIPISFRLFRAFSLNLFSVAIWQHCICQSEYTYGLEWMKLLWKNRRCYTASLGRFALKVKCWMFWTKLKAVFRSVHGYFWAFFGFPGRASMSKYEVIDSKEFCPRVKMFNCYAKKSVPVYLLTSNVYHIRSKIRFVLQIV